jgi:DNA-binding response OmpR family regulator
LTRASYGTRAAKTGHEAIDLMRVVAPRLAILDLRVSGLSGGEGLEYLHDSEVLRHVPVLIVSGFLEDEPFPVTTGLTIVGRLAEPLTIAALVEAVRTVLERSKPPDRAGVPLG